NPKRHGHDARISATIGCLMCTLSDVFRSGMKSMLAAGALLLLSMLPLCAQTEVEDCTEDALVEAMALDSYVVFTKNCNITLTDTITIDSDMTIDAQGHTVTINGGPGIFVLEVATGGSFTGLGLTMAGGQNTNGGALYINDGA